MTSCRRAVMVRITSVPCGSDLPPPPGGMGNSGLGRSTPLHWSRALPHFSFGLLLSVVNNYPGYSPLRRPITTTSVPRHSEIVESAGCPPHSTKRKSDSRSTYHRVFQSLQLRRDSRSTSVGSRTLPKTLHCRDGDDIQPTDHCLL
jgi:hypothetical protein